MIALAAAYDIIIEAGQAFAPHRTDFLISDAIVNTIDASAVLVWYRIEPHIDWHSSKGLLETVS
ncbi:hypothetical protein [Halovenus halobia]|uniref:hypothetical protein n=1 Tax=Halovenus halobia TaxID=3396622 RepID=UPI003F57DB50